MIARRSLLGAGAGGLALLLAGCATPVPPAPSAARPQAWSGRLALRVESEPVQTFAAVFDLRGDPRQGTLRLATPIGSTLAELEWSPGEALLRDGGKVRRYPSVEALIRAATGADIPVQALFAWLGGDATRIEGWRADLSQHANGRLTAVRESPAPRAELRVVFEAA